MQLNHQANKTLITGSSGTGKSSFFNSLFLNSEYDYKFLFDTEGEFLIRNPHLEKFLCEDFSSIEKVEKNRLCIFDPSSLEESLEESFAVFSQIVFDLSEILEGKKLFGSDELQLSNSVSDLSEGFGKCLEVGRRRGLDTMFIAQAPNLMHNRLRNQATRVVSFRLTSIPALKYITQEFGFEKHESTIQTLQDGEFLERNLRTGDIVKGDYFKKILTNLSKGNNFDEQ